MWGSRESIVVTLFKLHLGRHLRSRALELACLGRLILASFRGFKMRSDSEIKAKVVELLELEGDERSELIRAMDSLDTKALQMAKSRAHSVRGMLSALFWTLGYSFSDIRTQLVEPSLVRVESGQDDEV